MDRLNKINSISNKIMNLSKDKKIIVNDVINKYSIIDKLNSLKEYVKHETKDN